MQRESDKFIHLRFAGNVAGFGENFLRGKFFCKFVARRQQFFFAASAERDVRALTQKKFCDDFAESLAAAGDERVDVLEFHFARPTERCSTLRMFFNSFSRKRFASTKIGDFIVGTIFTHSAWRNCGHSVQTTAASAFFKAAATLLASEIALNSFGKAFTAGSNEFTFAPVFTSCLHNSTAALRRSVSVF